MNNEFRSISVYFNESNLLIGIPSTLTVKFDALVGIDSITNIQYPYTNDQLEDFILGVLNRCYTIYLEDIPKVSAIQQFTGTKSYKSSVKNLGLVSAHWLENEGYTITPTWQNAKMRNAFHDIEDKAIKLPEDYKPGELAMAFRKAMEMSPIGPQMSAPVLD